MRRLIATALAGLALAAAALAGAGTAAAHATRISADPTDQATLTESPERVSATFNEAMQEAFASMTVVGPDGNLWSTGDPQVTGAVISVAVRPLGPTGTYTANYRATSADGHVVSGSWTFELTVAGSGTPGPSATTPEQPGDSLPVWPFVLLATVIVGGGALWAVRRQS